MAIENTCSGASMLLDQFESDGIDWTPPETSLIRL